MSRLLSNRAKEITPYVPGEQPKDRTYIKLNTNENPYPPAPAVQRLLSNRTAEDLRLYPDPDATELRQAMADCYDLSVEQVFAGGGSDEVLAYAFMAFFDQGDKVYFPDITYGFYQVYADLFALTVHLLPLAEDFTINLSDYRELDGGIFLANPNAPTGICLSPQDIEKILLANPDQLVVVDEAYIDFSDNNTCIPLIHRYDNLLVIQTFSKSRALAGMRLGFGFGNPALLDGLERMKYSFNPYNLDKVSLDVGVASLSDPDYFSTVTEQIVETRERTKNALEILGFHCLPSQTNFLFTTHPTVDAAQLYEYLQEQSILVRYFPRPRIDQYLRVTIGTKEEMKSLIATVTQFLQERT